MSVRTEPRLTRDADLVVHVSGDADAEQLVRTLQTRGWRVVAALEQEATRRLATVRLALAVPVARIGHLIALKILARDDRTRPQDRVDLAGLLAHADATAMDEARRALALVTERGFHRGRDLQAALQATIEEFRPGG